MKVKFQQVCPYGRQYLERLTAGCIQNMILLFVLSVMLILLWNAVTGSFSVLYVMECICLAGYIIVTEVPNYKLVKIESKIYRELLVYFSRVKHRYSACRHIANAVLDASENMSYEIQRLANEMYKVLLECDRKEKVREYICSHQSNPFLKMFLIQAYETSEKGNTFFAENVEQLRLEIMEEIYRREHRIHEFAGYSFVAVTPFFMMSILKQWGVEFASELEFFYAGTGMMVEMVTFLTTILIYNMIARAKDITLFATPVKEHVWDVEWIFRNKTISSVVFRMEHMKGPLSCKIRKLMIMAGERVSFGRFCFRVSVLSIGIFLMVSGFFAAVHERERKLVLESVESIEIIAPVASEDKRDVLEGHILAVTRQCINEKIFSEETIKIMLRERIRLRNENVEMAAVHVIMEKNDQYSESEGSVLEILFSLLCGMCAGVIMILKLMFQAKNVSSGAVHEVRQFQSIVLMERRLKGVTMIGLLEDMELFARCFRRILRKCINFYGAGPQKALMTLKEEGSLLHKGFEELADAFLSVDEVGVETAFAEVENNRRLLERMTQLEADIHMERKKDGTDLISKIPMVLAVGCYFILPFFLSSLEGVYEVFELLEEMQL